MDKKSKYTQSSAKGTGSSDTKKNQDVVNGSKVFPKTSRRRESPGGGGFAKNEQQSRKSSMQKARSFDKRPKPKGQYHGGAKEDSKVVEEEAAELGSVIAPGSKKQNLNHLLNFHYAPCNAPMSSGRWNGGRTYTNRNNNRWLPPVHRHKYNKEQFLQANCQFVVNARGDYQIYLADPDILVDWKLIEQIRVHSSESLSCPICLCHPIAGKMTRCGHVYCWPCILHYLALSDKTWRKCPICDESVHKGDLKSVIEITQNPVNIGDFVRLRLMRRERGSLIATPVQQIDTATPTTFISVTEQNSHQIYSKLLLANVADVMEIIETERVQLKFELAEDPHSPENCFIERALDELFTREQQVREMLDVAKPKTELPVANENELCKGNEQVLEVKEMKCNFDQTPLLQDHIAAGNGESNNRRGEDVKTCDSTGNRPLSKYFYFYQAEDGQHLYLHAMNVKMLEVQYGNLEHCPRVIWGKLLEKEAGSFTEELRRRMRYLYHLPLTCQFEIAEIELSPPLINEEVVGYFAEQIENREKRRRRREREERKREKKITVEENKRMGKYPTPKVHIESHIHFPQWMPESQSAAMSLPSPSESVATSSVASSPSRGSFVDESSSGSVIGINNWPMMSDVCGDQRQTQGLSFAQMFRDSGSRTNSTNTSWPATKTTGTARTRPAVAQADPDEDTYAVVPSYNQSFGDALAHALDNTFLLDTNARDTEKANVTTPGQKKKKKKPTVLFATSMTRES